MVIRGRQIFTWMLNVIKLMNTWLNCAALLPAAPILLGVNRSGSAPLSPLEGAACSLIWKEGFRSSRKHDEHALRQPAGLESTLEISVISGRQTLRLWRPDIKIILPCDASHRALWLCRIHYTTSTLSSWPFHLRFPKSTCDLLRCIFNGGSASFSDSSSCLVFFYSLF